MNQVIESFFSHEEYVLFQSFKSQFDNSFNLYKQNNLAISKQEEELRALKYETESALESYNIQKEQCQENLESKDVLKDILSATRCEGEFVIITNK